MAKSAIRKKKSVPARLDLFGPPPLLEGENNAAYYAILKQVSDAVKPADIIDEFSVRYIVDVTWETLRLRRNKTELLAANMHRGLKQVLDPLCGYEKAEELSESWAQGDREAINEVDELLAAAGLSMNVVIAQTLAVKIDDFERIDRMTMNAEARRYMFLREIDRRRESLGRALRAATAGFEESSFLTVEHAPLVETAEAVPAVDETEEAQSPDAVGETEYVDTDGNDKAYSTEQEQHPTESETYRPDEANAA